MVFALASSVFSPSLFFLFVLSVAESRELSYDRIPRRASVSALARYQRMHLRHVHDRPHEPAAKHGRGE